MTDMLKTAPEVKAPEIKGMPETVTAAFEEFMEAFEAFKDVNDRRLGEIEQKLTSDVVTRDKMDRINRAMDDMDQHGALQGVRHIRSRLAVAGGKVDLDAVQSPAG